MVYVNLIGQRSSGLRWPIRLTTRDVYTTYWRSTIHLTQKMTSAQVVETSVKVTTNSPSQDYTHPDDHNLRTYDMTPGFKPFTIVSSVLLLKDPFKSAGGSSISPSEFVQSFPVPKNVLLKSYLPVLPLSKLSNWIWIALFALVRSDCIQYCHLRTNIFLILVTLSRGAKWLYAVQCSPTTLDCSHFAQWMTATLICQNPYTNTGLEEGEMTLFQYQHECE